MRKILTVALMGLLAIGCRGPAGNNGSNGQKGDQGIPGQGKITTIEGTVTADPIIVTNSEITLDASIIVYVADSSDKWQTAPTIILNNTLHLLTLSITEGCVQVKGAQPVGIVKYKIVIVSNGDVPAISTLAPRLL